MKILPIYNSGYQPRRVAFGGVDHGFTARTLIESVFEYQPQDPELIVCKRKLVQALQALGLGKLEGSLSPVKIAQAIVAIRDVK